MCYVTSPRSPVQSGLLYIRAAGMQMSEIRATKLTHSWLSETPRVILQLTQESERETVHDEDLLLRTSQLRLIKSTAD